MEYTEYETLTLAGSGGSRERGGASPSQSSSTGNRLLFLVTEIF